MAGFEKIGSLGVAALLLSGTSALAQVTAQEVWDDWQANFAIYGEEGVTVGSESYENGTLRVTDLAVAMSDETGSVSATLAEILMTEQGDGTVLVTMSEEYPIAFSGTDEFGTVTDVAMVLRQTGLTMTVSATEDGLLYDFAAPRYAFEVTSITENGVAVPAEIVVGLNNLTGTYLSMPGEVQAMSYEAYADTLDIKAAVADSETGTNVTVNGTMAELAVAADLALPELMDAMAPDLAFAAGLSMAGGYSFGATEISFSATDGMTPTDGTFTATGGSFDIAMDEESMAYDTSTTGVAVSVSSAGMPFPVNFAADELSMGFLIPVAVSDTPSEFAAALNLAGVALNEEIWGMFDPAQVLPRDPVTVSLDVTGLMKVLVNLTSPEAAGGMTEMGPPAEVHALTLNALRIAAGGAEVTATGDLTFDNTDMMTYGGVPKPVGSVQIALNGVYALMDKVAQLGFIPEDQIMGARMMIGAMTTPTGDDQMTATFEFTAEGGLLANGQRLQ